MQQPKSFEGLLHKYVSRMKTEYGYMNGGRKQDHLRCRMDANIRLFGKGHLRGWRFDA